MVVEFQHRAGYGGQMMLIIRCSRQENTGNLMRFWKKLGAPHFHELKACYIDNSFDFKMTTNGLKRIWWDVKVWHGKTGSELTDMYESMRRPNSLESMDSIMHDEAIPFLKLVRASPSLLSQINSIQVALPSLCTETRSMIKSAGFTWAAT